VHLEAGAENNNIFRLLRFFLAITLLALIAPLPELRKSAGFP